MHIKLGKRKIGKGHPVFIVAEMSGNHNKSLARALKIVDAASRAGADAIKLQTYTPNTLTIDSDKKWFKIPKASGWSGKTLYELYKQAYTPWEWHDKIKKHAEKKGLIFFSTPFDETAVDFLKKMNVPAYKVASFEIGDIELLKKIGQQKKPVIISRGMASKEEIKLALRALRSGGAKEIAVLHCVSAYPAKAEDMNLATIPDIAKQFKVVSGLSDHTLGSEAAIASVALGANIIEKHVTLKRSDGGPDAAFSLEPIELKEMVSLIRKAEKAIGRPVYNVSKSEQCNTQFKRSLFAVKDIKKGAVFNKTNVRSIRPGSGLSPKHYNEILKKSAKTDIEKGTPLSWKLVGK